MSKPNAHYQAAVLVCWLLLAWTVGAGALRAAEAPAERQAKNVLDRLGVSRGICVLAGQEPAEMAIALARQSQLTVYAQLPSSEATAAARARVDAAGLLGTRVYVEKGAWSAIHLADNLADAVVVMPNAVSAARQSRDELLRIVNPLGKVLFGDQEIAKSYPDEADDWSHPFHGPDNNPQSVDRLARGSYLTQFMSEPWYVPMPAVSVASAGRLFKAFGHIASNKRSFPWLNTLAAVNGYNGTLLWKRPLAEGFMIHRNTMIATPKILYLADNSSCKLIDTATGERKDEITVAEGAGGPSWKWMALDGGVLYALVGSKEAPDPTVSWNRDKGGWPWRPMSKGYDAVDYPWGFGHTFLAIEAETKRVLWTHTDRAPIDTRGVCMKNGRIFYYSHGEFLACLDAGKGEPVWRNADRELLDAIGPHFRAQTWQYGFSSTSYVKCSDEAIYFAGPTRPRLVAASTRDGRLLWQYEEGNFQLVLHNGDLYAMGSRQHPSKKFDPLTGQVLADLTCRRAACTRATGTIDSILCRAGRTEPSFHAGTLRLITADDDSMRIPLMRPPCHDGVIVANGLLHWGPWMCDCHLSLVGNLCLGPAGDFDFTAKAAELERLDPPPDDGSSIAPLTVASGDWPTYRANNQRSATTPTSIPTDIRLAWRHEPPTATFPAAPVTAGGLVFLAGSDGVVRAVDAPSGKLRWKGFTGGRIYYPPTVAQGRLLVGSGDGHIYAFEAATGRSLWTFRAAPVERKISLHGRLISNWPVASGVLVEDDVAYAAAGIASWDGTHVYALDVKTGEIRWQNNTSGHLAGGNKVAGVSVQGHLLLYKDRLHLAGGNVVSPAVYDLEKGQCLNTLEDEFVRAPRGSELAVIDGEVTAFGGLLYSPEEYWLGSFRLPYLLQANAAEVLIRSTGADVFRVDSAAAAAKWPKTIWSKRPKTIWKSDHFAHAVALALGNNAVVVAGQLPAADTQTEATYEIAALDVEDGHTLWRHPLPAMPLSWGVALDSAGRTTVALRNGQVLCFAAR